MGTRELGSSGPYAMLCCLAHRACVRTDENVFFPLISYIIVLQKRFNELLK